MNRAADWARTLGGLFVVLAMIVAAGWLLRCLQQRAGIGFAGLGRCRSQVITVVTQQMLGVRGKAIVADVGGTWLVLGVTQQHVQVLHMLSRPVKVASTPDGLFDDGTSGSDKPSRSIDTLSIQLKRHLVGELE